MSRDENKFKFRCKHDDEPDHNHAPIEMEPEMVLQLAVTAGGGIGGILEVSQKGMEEGIEDMPMIFLKILTASDKANVFLCDPEMAVRLGTDLITWGLMASIPDMDDDA